MLEGFQTCAERAVNLNSRSIAQSSTLNPLGSAHGFLALPWIAGYPLSRNDAPDRFVRRQIAHHIATVARPSLMAITHSESVLRLSEMLYWNTHQALGECMAERTHNGAKVASTSSSEPSYGDGHLAPYEWVRIQSGHIFKTDSFGHNVDHTIIGEQSVLWDVAGAIIEWELTADARTEFLSSIQEFMPAVQLEALGFYRMAYTAFGWAKLHFVLT